MKPPFVIGSLLVDSTDRTRGRGETTRQIGHGKLDNL